MKSYIFSEIKLPNRLQNRLRITESHNTKIQKLSAVNYIYKKFL